jgi:ribosomal-protein-alanine N-acetyltransferase
VPDVPRLVAAALPAGALRALPQPRLALGDDLLLRPWQPDDAERVWAAFAEPDIQRWHTLRIDSRAEAEDWIADWARRWAAETDASWAVARTHDDRAVGQVGLRAIEHADARADVSYWVTPAARGAGVAARATRAMTAWAFGTLGLHRLMLQHSTANEASCRVAAVAGYRLEGVLRGAARHADGWHDMHLHARLAAGTAP